MMLPCQTHRNGIRAPTQTVSRHVKMAIVDWRVTPQIAINDPEVNGGHASVTDRRNRYGCFNSCH